MDGTNFQANNVTICNIIEFTRHVKSPFRRLSATVSSRGRPGIDGDSIEQGKRMEIIAKLGSLLGLSFISGINLYATVAVTGICAKYHLIRGLPPEFNALANDGVILIAFALYMLEFFMDKIPGLDALWDLIHTLIRPLGGALIALMQVGDASPATQVIVFMLGASLASMAHLTKAGVRLIINTSPEPFSNIAVSLGEDGMVIGLSYLSLAYPKTSFFLVLAMLCVTVLVLPLLIRTVRMLFAALFFRIKCFFDNNAPLAASRNLPFVFDVYLDRQTGKDENIRWTGRVYAVSVPNVSKFVPMQAVVASDAVYFLFRKWFRMQFVVLNLGEIQMEKKYPGRLLNKWFLKTSKGEWLLYLYSPLAATLQGVMVQRAPELQKEPLP